MSEALDTSVVLRLLTGAPSGQAELARRHLEQAGTPVWVDALVIGESYFALRHHYAVPHAAAVDALLALLASGRVSSSDASREALADVARTSEPGVMDRLILGAAREGDRVLRTFDRRLATLDGANLLR